MTRIDRDRMYPWLAILRAKFMGSGRARALAEYFGSIERALHASPADIAAVPRFNEEMGLSVQKAARGEYDEAVEREIKWCERNGVDMLLYTDAAYPEQLKQIPAPPALLYVKGSIRREDILSIGVVGTRRASDHARRMANRISNELAEAGLTIISGLAFGIDGAAHKGALKCNHGRTLACLGNGLKHIYPREHKNLYEQVFKRGALITELFYDVAPDGRNFPPRNRIISGLSLGVLVVEAPSRSGALITADYALEQGREVYALPGAVDQWNAEGGNRLISESAAKLVTSADDIIRDLEDKIAYYQHELKGEISKIDERSAARKKKNEPPIELKSPQKPEEPEIKAAEPPKPKASPKPEPKPAPPVQKPEAIAESKSSSSNQPPGLSDDELTVWNALTDSAKHIDAISRELEWPAARVSAALGLLELKGHADREAGMRFRRGE